MSRATDQAYGRIRSMILSGEVGPGMQLREEQLAARCGVSRTPVRDALRRLETENLIRRNGSQRSFVADWSIDEMEELFQLRGMLEAHAAGRAATRLGWDQIERLRALNRALLAAISATLPDIPAFIEHNRAFHTVIVEGARSDRLSNMLGRLIEQPVVLRTAMQYDRDNLLRSHREHEELIAAFSRRDSDWAEAVMTGHIRRAFHAYVDAHERAGSNDQPGIAA